MIKITYLLSLLLFFPPVVLANMETSNFSFNCKIVDQQLFTVEEGKPDRYQGYSGYKDVGDTFQLKFSFIGGFKEEHFDMQILNTPEELELYLAVNVNQDGLEIDDSSGVIRWGHKAILGENIINLDYALTRITGKRYYRNDWNMILAGGGFDSILIRTANCMNVPKEYGLMLDLIRSKSAK